MFRSVCLLLRLNVQKVSPPEIAADSRAHVTRPGAANWLQWSRKKLFVCSSLSCGFPIAAEPLADVFESIICCYHFLMCLTSSWGGCSAAMQQTGDKRLLDPPRSRYWGNRYPSDRGTPTLSPDTNIRVTGVVEPAGLDQGG